MTFAMQMVGFDVRELWMNPDLYWPHGNKDEFLLRLDVERPLSVDLNLWHSFFDVEHVPRPAFVGWGQDQWRDLKELEEYIRVYELPGGRRHAVIAIALVTSAGRPVPSVFGGDLDVVSPDGPMCDWRCLGFDAATEWLLSGVTGCGYDDDIAVWRGEWRHVLNDHHLFPDVATAIRFARLTDRRVPEHAPFFVFGIWQVREAYLRAAERKSIGNGSC